MLTVGSLFTGIGGIDLGLERTGHFRTIWMSEIDSYANRVLAKHWPDVPNLGNIKEIDFERVERPDVITGGYPCQPFSTAGKRKGENDPRHLWPECLRALRILRPRYAIFENVRGHLTLGFPRVLTDLASIGFDAEWQIIPAAAVGAPHKRDRLFIVAYPNGGNAPDGGKCADVSCQSTAGGNDGSGSGSDTWEKCVGSPGQIARNVADTDHAGIGTPASGMERERSESFQERDNPFNEFGGCRTNVADTESIKSDGRLTANDRKKFREKRLQIEIGASGANVADPDKLRAQIPTTGQQPSEQEFKRYTWWEIEPDVGRVAHGVPARVDRLRALGNAVVPQVAEAIGYMIAAHAYA